MSRKQKNPVCSFNFYILHFTYISTRNPQSCADEIPLIIPSPFLLTSDLWYLPISLSKLGRLCWPCCSTPFPTPKIPYQKHLIPVEIGLDNRTASQSIQLTPCVWSAVSAAHEIMPYFLPVPFFFIIFSCSASVKCELIRQNRPTSIPEIDYFKPLVCNKREYVYSAV